MQVLPDPRAGAVTQIHAEIKPFRLVELPMRPDPTFCQLHHFRRLIDGGIVEPCSMGVWRHHEMPRRVWKKVEDDEIMGTAINDQSIIVSGCIVADAEGACDRYPSHRRDVVIAPWAPQKLHATPA